MTTQAGATKAYRRFVLVMLFGVFTLNFLDRQIIGILASLIKRDLALSDTQLGLMGGLAFALLYTILGIPVALVADRSRRTSIVAGAMTLWSLFTALCGAATGFWSLFLARVGVGIGESGGVTPCYSLISDYFPPHKRARALAVFAFGVPVGSALGLLIGGMVAAAIGWRGAFVTVGCIGLVFAPLLFLTVREPTRGGMDVDAGGVAISRTTLRSTLAYLRDKPAFWLLSFSGGVISMMSYGLAFWLPSFFQRGPGLDLATTAKLMAMMTLLSGCVGSPLGGILGDRLGSRDFSFYAYLPALSCVVALPALVVGMATTSLPLSVLLLMIPMAAGCFWVPPTLAAMQLLLPAPMRTTGAALYALIVNLLGLGLGTVLFGLVSDLAAARMGQGSLHFSVVLGGCVIYPAAAILYLITARRLAADRPRRPAALAVAAS